MKRRAPVATVLVPQKSPSLPSDVGPFARPKFDFGAPPTFGDRERSAGMVSRMTNGPVFSFDKFQRRNGDDPAAQAMRGHRNAVAGGARRVPIKDAV